MWLKKSFVSVILFSSVIACGDKNDEKDTGTNPSVEGAHGGLVDVSNFKNTVSKEEFGKKGQETINVFSDTKSKILSKSSLDGTSPRATISQYSFLLKSANLQSNIGESDLQKIPSENVFDAFSDVFFPENANCEDVLRGVSQIFATQEKELKDAVTFIKEMQNENDRLKLLESQKKNVKVAQKENTAVSFEYSEGDMLFGSMSGAANENIVLIENKSNIKAEKLNFDGNMIISADLKKQMIDFSAEVKGSGFDSKSGNPEKFYLKTVISTENGARPKLTVGSNITVSDGQLTFKGQVESMDLNRLLITSTVNVTGEPSLEHSYEVIKNENGKCRISNEKEQSSPK